MEKKKFPKTINNKYLCQKSKRKRIIILKITENLNKLKNKNKTYTKAYKKNKITLTDKLIFNIIVRVKIY